MSTYYYTVQIRLTLSMVNSVVQACDTNSAFVIMQVTWHLACFVVNLDLQVELKIRTVCFAEHLSTSNFLTYVNVQFTPSKFTTAQANGLHCTLPSYHFRHLEVSACFCCFAHGQQLSVQLLAVGYVCRHSISSDQITRQHLQCLYTPRLSIQPFHYVIAVLVHQVTTPI